MASSGKKGKKNKGTVISLQSFLSNGDAPAGTTQVSKKVRNLDGDDSDDSGAVLPLVYQLPTAPRANRIFNDNSIPQKPPFIACVTNLPFDIIEDDMYEYFGSYNIKSVRLPREDSESNRVRGLGYVELETRDDLIQVLSLPDPFIKGRRVRIDLSNENEQYNKGQRGNRRGFDNFGHNSENKESSNWRRDNHDNKFESNRSYSDSNSPGSWRKGNRSNISSSSFNRDNRENNSSSNQMNESLQERPKLNLKPRTLPLPEIVSKPESDTEPIEKVVRSENKPSGASSEKVFGSAKPVDTTARDLEIEERLAESRRQDATFEDNEVCQKIKDINIEKDGKENSTTQSNWRVKSEIGTEHDKDNKRREHHRDSNRYNRDRERNERSQNRRNNKVQVQEAKPKVESKRLELKTNRVVTKNISSQQEPVLQSSNMYSGLDEEISE